MDGGLVSEMYTGIKRDTLPIPKPAMARPAYISPSIPLEAVCSCQPLNHAEIMRTQYHQCATHKKNGVGHHYCVLSANSVCYRKNTERTEESSGLETADYVALQCISLMTGLACDAKISSERVQSQCSANDTGIIAHFERSSDVEDKIKDGSTYWLQHPWTQ